jgi:hypothetical protein
MTKKKRIPRVGQIIEIGPFKTWEEIEREANKALKELGHIEILNTESLCTKIGNFLVISYKLNRKQGNALLSADDAVQPLRALSK